MGGAKIRRKQPGRTAMRFSHLRTVEKEACTFTSGAGGRGTVDQAAAHRTLGQMGYSNMCVNGTLSKCLRFFMVVAVRSHINIRKRVPAVFASYTLGVHIYIYTRYVNLCFVCRQQKIKVI